MVYRATILVKEDFAFVLWIRSLITVKSRCQADTRTLMAYSAGHQWSTDAKVWLPHGGRSTPTARPVRPRRPSTCPLTPVLSFPLLASSFACASARSSESSPPSPYRPPSLHRIASMPHALLHRAPTASPHPLWLLAAHGKWWIERSWLEFTSL